MRWIRNCCAGLVLFSTVVALADDSPRPPGAPMLLSVRDTAPKAEVSLLANRSAVVPGKAMQLAIRFQVAQGWHTYWRNHGFGAGMEPKFNWQLPEGFEVGPVQFPAPEYYVDSAGETSYVLTDEAVLLTELRAPAQLQAGSDVTIGLDAEWLVCKDLCAIEKKSLSLKLPVVADESAVQVTHADLFDHAQRQLPLPMDKAKYLKKLWAVASVEKVPPGGSFQIAVVLDIADKHHLNSNEPLEEELIPTRVFPDTIQGALVEAPVYPAGKVEQTGLGKLSVYSGRAVIRLPATAEGELTESTLRFGGVVTYQACTEEPAACFPPVTAEWELTLPVAEAGEPIKAAHAEFFADTTDTSTASGSTGQGFDLDAPITSSAQSERHSLAGWLFFAFLAGLLLNITPCVLPVISIKVLSFVEEASQSPAKVFKLGLAFSLGMLLVFNVLAVLATAAGLAWGQHFQSPAFSIAMASIVFAFSLSLFGVFTLGVPVSVGDLSTKAETEGYIGSVAKGAFATIMGTPCVGPFLGPVLVWAAAQPAGIVLLVFNTIGLGMALPYALLAANPKWLRFVPRPGPWLVIFKQAMAFVLLAIVVKLLSITEAQLGGSAIVSTLFFFTALALGCWIVGTWMTPLASSRQRWVAVLAAVAVVAVAGWYSFRGLTRAAQPAGPLTTEPAGGTESRLPWTPYSLAKLTELTSQGKTVLLDITAAWCSNCHANTKFVFNTPEMLAAVKEHGVIPMLADWTNNDPEIGKLIAKLAPGGSVPLCAVFPADRPNEPIVMLGLVTKQQVIDAMKSGTGG